MEVARRAGLRVEGVGLPGHFIVRVRAGSHAVLIDPFHAGALLSENDCQQRLDRIFGGRLKMEQSMLAPCGRKDILERTLRNLKTIYFKQGDHPRALSAVELLLTVNPGSAEDVRDRGVLYAALDCYGLAVRDLEAFLTLVPRAPEAAEVRDQLVDLRRRAARLN
jgi:regulator of sirC expression with transglutaminase-like and TPR domain